MTRLRVRFSDLRWTSRLFRDFIYRPGALDRWLGGDFREPSSLTDTALRLSEVDFARSRLADILRTQNERFGAPEEVFHNIGLIENHGALCAVTGHQVVMLGGPLLVLLKAYSVIAIARKLTEKLDVPVVPVFWLASDDHDLAEVADIRFPGPDGRLEKVVYEPGESDSGKPMSDIRLKSSVGDFLGQVSQHLADTEFKDGLMGLFGEFYRQGSSIPDAFARLLVYLLGNYGLIVIDPGDGGGLKSIARDVFRCEVTHFEEASQAIADANRSLTDAGYHLQSERNKNYLRIFFHSDRRRKIEYDRGEFAVDGFDQRWSQKQLLESINESPESFSPDVLLRLVVQSKLLPAIAFIGGPAEIAYFAQTCGLFPIFGIVQPVVYPRLSATLVEKRWLDFIDRNRIDLSRLPEYESREAYLTSILAELFPEDVEHSLEVSRKRISGEFERMAKALQPDDRLARTVEQTRRKVDYQLNSLKDKVFKAHRRDHDDFSRNFRRMAELIFPEQSIQERHCSFVYFANKYGPGILDEIFGSLDTETCEHQVIGLRN